MSRRFVAAALAAAVLSAGAGFGAWHWWNGSKDADTWASVAMTAQFQGLDGKPHTLSEWNGKLLLVNFWASWCVPCLNEIPLLIEAQKAHGARGFQVVGLAMDTREQVQAMQKRLGINYPLLLGQANVMDAMDALGDPLGAFPFSVLIGPDGRILARVAGGVTRDELQSWLAS
jgi:thiol-disulfide isomerase/thioredoxin